MGGAQRGARGTAGHPAQVSPGNIQQAKAGCVPRTFCVLTGATDGGLKQATFILSRAGGQMSEIEPLAGPRSLPLGALGSTLPASSKHPLACGHTLPIFSPSSHGLLPCVCVSSSREVVGFGPTLLQLDLIST